MNLSTQHILLSTLVIVIALVATIPYCNAIDKLDADHVFDIVRDLSLDKDDIEATIVNGTEVEVGTYPWFASVAYKNQYFCGGALISHDWVLTAAHCIHNFGASLKKFGSVYVGALCKPLEVGESNCGQKGRKFRILEVKYHPGFEWDGVAYDIGLIRLHDGESNPYAVTHQFTPVDIDQGDIASGYDELTTNLWTPGESKDIVYLLPIDAWSCISRMLI